MNDATRPSLVCPTSQVAQLPREARSAAATSWTACNESVRATRSVGRPLREIAAADGKSSREQVSASGSRGAMHGAAQE